MLRWRILLGTLLIAFLAALAWADHQAPIPGLWLAPVLVAFCLLGTAELLRLLQSGGMQPLAWVVYVGNLLILASNWGAWACRSPGPSTPGSAASVPANFLTPTEWILLAFSVGLLLAFLGEMSRYRGAGGAVRNLAASVFCLAYLGVLLSFAVQLRLTWGVGSLAALLIVVKMGDTGAYIAGHMFGRRQLAPLLSPNKTIEGAIGAVVFSCGASWASFRWVVPHAASPTAPAASGWGWIVFGLLIAAAGMLGDLAESLIKRDVQTKDSGQWIPGFGGALDMLDSVLLAAPAGYLFWACGLATR